MVAFYLRKIQNDEITVASVPLLWRSRVQAALNA